MCVKKVSRVANHRRGDGMLTLCYGHPYLLTMVNAIYAYGDDHQALDDIAAEAWKRLYLEPDGARRDQNRRVTEVIFAEAMKKGGRGGGENL